MSNNLTTITSLIDESEMRYGSIVAEYKWPLIPASQLQAAKQALTKSEYMMKIACADPEAVRDALFKSAVLGLDLTEGKRQGWLVPRKNQFKKTVICLQVGYKGVEAIHQGMGVIDRLAIRIVRENDQFDWSGDDQEKPSHVADWFGSESDRGPIKGVFSITYFPDKSMQVMVTGISEIFEKHRNVSDSWKTHIAKVAKKEYSYPPVWETFEKAMVEKTMAFIASKQWPANIRDKETSSKILETLHEADIQDYSSIRNKYSLQQKEAFDLIVESNDHLGMFLFEQYVEKDIYIALYNSFPEGKKVSGKKQCRELSKIGSDLYADICVAINSDDDLKLKESIDGTNDFTLKMLEKRLEPDALVSFNELIEIKDTDVELNPTVDRSI